MKKRKWLFFYFEVNRVRYGDFEFLPILPFLGQIPKFQYQIRIWVFKFEIWIFYTIIVIPIYTYHNVFPTKVENQPPLVYQVLHSFIQKLNKQISDHQFFFLQKLLSFDQNSLYCTIPVILFFHKFTQYIYSTKIVIQG